MTAEVTAIVREDLFAERKGPVVRIGSEPIPPHSPPLVPTIDRILAGTHKLLGPGYETAERQRSNVAWRRICGKVNL